MTDLPLDATVITRREALEIAHGRLLSVVRYCLDLGLKPDEIDCTSIREAFEMVTLALKGGPENG